MLSCLQGGTSIVYSWCKHGGAPLRSKEAGQLPGWIWESPCWIGPRWETCWTISGWGLAWSPHPSCESWSNSCRNLALSGLGYRFNSTLFKQAFYVCSQLWSVGGNTKGSRWHVREVVGNELISAQHVKLGVCFKQFRLIFTLKHLWDYCCLQ